MVLPHLLGWAFLGSSGALLGPAALLLSEAWTRRMMPHFVSLAIGTLLGVGFLGLFPPALEALGIGRGLGAVLAGLLVFFVIEKAVHWRHSHDLSEADEPCDESHVHGAAYVLLIADGLHNFLDGLIIGATAVTEPGIGAATVFAVLAHEIPQEMGKFALLLHAGMGRRRAFLMNYLSAVLIFPGALLSYGLLDRIRALAPWFYAMAGAGFLYVAMADLVPAMHRRNRLAALLSQLTLVAAGVGLIALLRHSH